MSDELRAASLLIDRLQWARKMGLTFKGNRDIAEVLGYPEVITAAMHRDRYDRGGISHRIVEAFPTATWRGGGTLYEDDDPDIQTQFELIWLKLENRLKIWSVLKRVDTLSRLGNYAVLLIGAPGAVNTELPRVKTPDALNYLRPINQDDAKVESWVENPEDKRFAQPLTYQLTIRLQTNTPNIIKSIHWSRIIHLAEGALDNDLYGMPALEACWNDLLNLEKVTGGGSEAFWLRANQGLHINIDKDMVGPSEVTEKELADLKKQTDEYRHKQDRIIRTRGVDVETLGSDVAEFGGSADALISQIAGTIGIPKRILIGSEMGQLASGQDRDNWDSQIQDRRTGHIEPNLVRPFVDRLIEYGYLPTPKEYHVDWPTVGNLTEEEKADGAVKWSTVNKNYGHPVFTDEEIREHFYDLAPLTPEEKDAATPEVSEPAMPAVKVKKIVDALANAD